MLDGRGKGEDMGEWYKGKRNFLWFSTTPGKRASTLIKIEIVALKVNYIYITNLKNTIMKNVSFPKTKDKKEEIQIKTTMRGHLAGSVK